MSIFSKKKVLITGHTGFKGSWLSIWLKELGAEVYGLSDTIVSTPSNYEVCGIRHQISERFLDIRNSSLVEDYVTSLEPDFVFHLAAQALVRESYVNPLHTITTNSIGTANVLNSLKSLKKKVIAVMITSDKAYDNLEWVWGYKETDKIGGKDPYSASKGMAELVIRSYCESFFPKEGNIRVGITRAGNVIGGGDWAKDRIVPDSMIAWSRGESVEIRNLSSTRPWQHVLEPLSGYLTLAADLYMSNTHHGEAYNFGPISASNHTVGDLLNEMGKFWEKVQWKDNFSSSEAFHEAGLLKLNCDKALHDLNWRPTLTFNEVVEMTVQWYRNFYSNKSDSIYLFTKQQISDYTNLAKARGLDWTENV